MKYNHGITNFIKVLFLTGALLPVSVIFASDEKDQADNPEEYKPQNPVLTIEEIVVRAQRREGFLDEHSREYKTIDGKRVFYGPYGELEYILTIGQELKNRGEMKRIMSRRIKMPAEFPGSTLDRYKYPVAHECGVEKFQLFDGGEFMALGYEPNAKSGKTEIIFDVMIGGGPFSAPGIWGPYDQIIGRRHKMKLIMGDAESDGMGIMKSGYAIGMRAELPTHEIMDAGDMYNAAVTATGKCLIEKFNIEVAKNFLSKN